MNRLSLMVLALTMSSPTLLAGVVENYDFKENHTGYTDIRFTLSKVMIMKRV